MQYYSQRPNKRRATIKFYVTIKRINVKLMTWILFLTKCPIFWWLNHVSIATTTIKPDISHYSQIKNNRRATLIRDLRVARKNGLNSYASIHLSMFILHHWHLHGCTLKNDCWQCALCEIQMECTVEMCVFLCIGRVVVLSDKAAFYWASRCKGAGTPVCWMQYQNYIL